MKYREFIESSSGDGLKTSIGSHVKFKNPVLGADYGQVDGFVMAPGAQLAAIPGVGIAPTGKVAKIKVSVYSKPGGFPSDFVGKADVDRINLLNYYHQTEWNQVQHEMKNGVRDQKGFRIKS